MTGTFVREDRFDKRASLTAAMRTSNQFAHQRRRLRSRSLAAGLIAMGLFVAGCGTPAPSVEPATPKPTPVITPNPQMTDPASAEALFTAIARMKLPITANNAAAGNDPVKTINATYHDWPMLISEYKSAATLAKLKAWKPGDPPLQGEAPVAIKGLNILIEWGPSTAAKPPVLDAAQVKIMDEFLKAIDPYIGPLTVRTTTELAVPIATPAPTPKASPSASAGASAAPSKQPKPSP